MAERNSNPTARDDEKQGEGGEEVLFNATRHDHELLLFKGLPRYTCSGCKEYGANKGYKCKISSSSECKNFTLHDLCAALPDAIHHSFRSDVIIKFRSKTLLRHHCSACCEVMKGFVFETEWHNTMLHPLCMALPKVLDYDGHANHKLKIVTGDLKGKAYTCSACDGYIACGGWRYWCDDVACKVYVDPSCAKIDIFGLSEHGIHRVASVGHSKSGGKTEISAGLVQSIITGVSEHGGSWRYRCKDVARKVYGDPSCAKNDIFGLSEHGIHRVASVGHSTSGGKTEISAGLVQSTITGVSEHGVGWRYRCEDVARKVYGDPSCARNNIFGFSEHRIHRVASVGHITSGGKTEILAGLVQSIITGVSEHGGRWRYRCEDMARKVYVDPSCAINDIFGLSEHGIHRVASVGHSTSGGVMSQNPGLQYDVFINHRGTDVKNSLVSLIYHQLKTKDPNLRVFLDKHDIPYGDDFELAIETAIESSSLHIAIFSERYAESKWCLHELDLIIKSRRKLIPVFCDIDPAALRRIEKGCYQEAFEKHRGREPLEKTKRWEDALTRASYLQGLPFKMKESDHWEFVEKIVSIVLMNLKEGTHDRRTCSGT